MYNTRFVTGRILQFHLLYRPARLTCTYKHNQSDNTIGIPFIFGVLWNDTAAVSFCRIANHGACHVPTAMVFDQQFHTCSLVSQWSVWENAIVCKVCASLWTCEHASVFEPVCKRHCECGCTCWVCACVCECNELWGTMISACLCRQLGS